jgi:isoleucyl-tRNA synthetase
MPFASLHYPFENKEVFDKNYPADFIAESMDQTRGWFYSLINLGVGLSDKAPYKHVICNGLINAADGKKLSKSLGNYTDPLLLVEKYGADAFRYYMMSSPVVKGEGVNFDDKELEDVYKKCVSRLDNVVSLYEMNKPEGIVAKNSSPKVLDIWMISRVHELVRDATLGYDAYKLDEATRGIAVIIDDISVWYTRRSRDRLKGDTGEEDQLFAYETLTYVLETLAKVMAPVMPFIAERVYKGVGGERESVHLESWPEGGDINDDVIASMKQVRTIVSEVLMIRNKLNIPVRQPLASFTTPCVLSDEYLDIIKDEVNVKTIVRGELTTLDTVVTTELQAEGDVRNLMRAVQDARKSVGLSPKDEVTLMTSYTIPDAFKNNFMKTCNIVTIVDGTGEHKAETSTGTVMFGLTKL